MLWQRNMIDNVLGANRTTALSNESNDLLFQFFLLCFRQGFSL